METKKSNLGTGTLGMEFPAKVLRNDEIRDVMTRMTEDHVWDTIQARDLPPEVIAFVEKKIMEDFSIGEICQQMGIPGKNSKQWKKIAAYFRQGFRADAEVYLHQQTHKFYKVIQKAKDVLEDAFENGTPTLVPLSEGKDMPDRVEVIRVKGATKELAGFLKAYAEAISLPVKLWKDYGAIGEKKDVGTTGITINVTNNIPMPTVAEIEAHQQEMIAKANAIVVNDKK